MLTKLEATDEDVASSMEGVAPEVLEMKQEDKDVAQTGAEIVAQIDPLLKAVLEQQKVPMS